MHLLVFKAKSPEVISREYLRDSSPCLDLDFDQCDQIDTELMINMSDQDDQELQTCFHRCTLRFAEEDIFIKKRFFRKREPYFEVHYLHLTRSRGPRLQFEIGARLNDDEDVFSPDELFEPFVQVDENLTIGRNEYKALLERAQMRC